VSAGGVSAWAWSTSIQRRPRSLLAFALARSGGVRTDQPGLFDGKPTRTAGSEASEDRKRCGSMERRPIVLTALAAALLLVAG
jgi:hypothetical protein